MKQRCRIVRFDPLVDPMIRYPERCRTNDCRRCFCVRNSPFLAIYRHLIIRI